jgi:hypothetical protein
MFLISRETLALLETFLLSEKPINIEFVTKNGS